MLGELNSLCSKESVLLSHLLPSSICALEMSAVEHVTASRPAPWRSEHRLRPYLETACLNGRMRKCDSHTHQGSLSIWRVSWKHEHYLLDSLSSVVSRVLQLTLGYGHITLFLHPTLFPVLVRIGWLEVWNTLKQKQSQASKCRLFASQLLSTLHSKSKPRNRNSVWTCLFPYSLCLARSLPDFLLIYFPPLGKFFLLLFRFYVSVGTMSTRV